LSEDRELHLAVRRPADPLGSGAEDLWTHHKVSVDKPSNFLCTFKNVTPAKAGAHPALCKTRLDSSAEAHGNDRKESLVTNYFLRTYATFS